jgi:hypothetical protein
MNARLKKLLSGAGVKLWLPRVLAFGLLAGLFAGWIIADEPQAQADLTAHEWGTFTAIAGKDGNPVQWTPITGATDVPRFVEHLSGANLKPGLSGTIRMETPVLYFYSPREVTLSVKARFSKGLITEWYPHAARVEPSGALGNPNLSRLRTDGSIMWSGVTVSPNLSGDFPREGKADRYYAARETSSTPLRVATNSGEQQEKFLFYRGVSAARLPLSAKLNPDGKLAVKNLSHDDLPAMILFERRGERVGYRLAGALTDEIVLDSPVLTGSVDALCSELERILVNQGLYPDEAHAMVETWQDSWFEEGSRLIYIVPRGFIDRILPLTIDPAPEQMVRVFVGRLEIVTPATASAVRTAVACNDEITLNKYGRFLRPILDTVGEGHFDATQDCRNGR